ncbi:Cysteine-rich domain-containing protein [Desulfacinum hydrothermale DSM 13146]|uniref:Cysteine-rich domain-containing protein n=1 Tax=Desulfacinum hydrothermale DSM 13146 TaxID=1121390 RepID=A0A1W1XIY8_9BACT|nr:Cysteine-rich domain-containing protein [Desulfacinum hydrothermale DSM 13146]
MLSIFDLLMDYVQTGRLELDPRLHPETTTFHDSCHYGRKSLQAFGHGYFEEGRWLVRQCCPNYVEMYPNREGNYCCGGGGGLWSVPFHEERVFHGRFKARQIRNCGARRVVTACHNCRDQMEKSLRKEYDLDVEVVYLWELLARSLAAPGRRSSGGSR